MWRMKHATPSVDVTQVDDARTRLLIAAERLILRGGLAAVSLRKIAQEAGAHPALVAYYFGNLPGLLTELANANQDVTLLARSQMLAAAANVVGAGPRLAAGIEAYVSPILYASAYCKDRPASSVVRELISGGDAALRQNMVQRINHNVNESANFLLPLLPHLSKSSLVLRLRLLTGAAIYLLPQISDLGLFHVEQQAPMSAERAYQELLVFARGALLVA